MLHIRDDGLLRGGALTATIEFTIIWPTALSFLLGAAIVCLTEVRDEAAGHCIQLAIREDGRVDRSALIACLVIMISPQSFNTPPGMRADASFICA